MSTQSKKPKKFAGQEPPDDAFYKSTYKETTMTRFQMGRGLHIDNELARQIDAFIEPLLRKESPLAADEDDVSGDETESRQAKLWELDTSAKANECYLDSIYSAVVDEFPCFQTKWMKNHSIPWCWHTFAIHV